MFSSELAAQTDSTFTDTVVIIKDPYVIRHEVVIRLPSEPVRKMPPVKLGFYYGAGKNFIQSSDQNVEVSGQMFHGGGIQIGYFFRNIEFTVGIGSLSTRVKHTIINQYEVISYNVVIEDTLLDSYVIDGKTYTVTEPDTNIYEIKSVEYNNQYLQRNIKFLQIPFSIGYNFKFLNNRVIISPGFQIIANKVLSRRNNYLFEQKNTCWFYGIQLKIEYSFLDHFSVEIKGFYQQSLGNIYKEGYIERWNLSGLNAGLNYTF